MKYIYIDSLFFLSLFTDYLLCLITARICRLCLRRRRYLAAALLGAHCGHMDSPHLVFPLFFVV